MTTNRSKDSPGVKVQSNNSQKTTQPKQKARSRWQTLMSEGERRGQTPRRCAHARFAARRALGTSLPYDFPKAPRILAKGWGAVATNHHGASESSGSRCCAALGGGAASRRFMVALDSPRRGFSEIKPNSSSECRTSARDYRAVRGRWRGGGVCLSFSTTIEHVERLSSFRFYTPVVYHTADSEAFYR